MNIEENQNTTEIQPEVVSTNVEATPKEDVQVQDKASSEPKAETKTTKTNSIKSLREKASSLSDEPKTVLKKKADVKEGEPKLSSQSTKGGEPLPAYSPDYKYKANGKEKEIDERLRPLIKDKETEEWIKKILSKADGLEEVLAHREHYRNQFNTLNAQANAVISDVKNRDYSSALQKLGVDTNDIKSVMSGLKFKKEDIIRYAYELAQLTPEQEAAYARERELELSALQQQSQVEQLHQRLYQQEVQLKTSELKMVLSTPDYAPLVEAFDQKNGQGAFWDEVCRRGEYYDLKGSPKQVMDLVNEVGSIAKLLVTQTPAQAQATPAANQQVKQNVVPVIPNVSGASASPARKKTKSLKELREYAKTLSD